MRLAPGTIAMVLALFCAPVLAQTAPATQVAGPLVTLDFPADGIELKTLADIVSKQLKIPILYDESINAKKVTIRVPRQVPESSLLGILESALHLKQMALIDADQPGWKQIVPATNVAGGPKAPPVVKFVPLHQADAKAVASSISTMLTNRDQAAGAAAGASGVFIDADERLNEVAVVAPANRIDEVTSLIEAMDRTPVQQTVVYRLKLITPERLDRLVRNLLGPTGEKQYQGTADRESQSLVVSAAPAVHQRIAHLLVDLDAPVAESQSPMRFYKLKNTKAADLLATISGLQGEGGIESFHAETDGGVEQINGPTPTSPAAETTHTPETSPPPPQPTRLTPAPPALTTPSPSNPAASSMTGTLAARQAPYGAPTPAGVTSVQTRNATVTADINTNTIIVIAPPAVQQMYAELIHRLDERRPQVQIECTIVTLDTTDGFSLGVDIAKLGGFGDSQLLTFTSFGVSKVDPATGRLTPIAAPGGTAALLSTDIADIVLHALATNTHARLVSAPQLLVNDNGRGTLKSVAQEPYAQILDSSSVQAITSFGGNAEAGTTITVEPHISADDYLQLSYSIELSSFTGRGTNNLPPPAQTNSVDSTVTIPDGYTIVVGGLSVKNLRETLDTLPFIQQIPIINLLFSSRTKDTKDTTLFIFIRPRILRDDKFEDLKYISERSGDRAGIPPSHPQSEPIPIR